MDVSHGTGMGMKLDLLPPRHDDDVLFLLIGLLLAVALLLGAYLIWWA